MKGIVLTMLMVFLITAPAFAAPADTWKTGQTTSYYAGDDGDLQRGVTWPDPRFQVTYCDGSGPCSDQSSDCDSDPFNDVVYDGLTDLTWARDANLPGGSGTRDWQGALDYVDTLNSSDLCGQADWRLPNRKELFSLIDFSQYGPALQPGHPFVNVQSGYYWSGTSYAGGTGYAWVVYVGDGSVHAGSKSHGYYVWPVRAGQVGPSVILDHFLCYKTRTTKGTPKFEPISGVSLADQFEDKVFDVKKPVTLCTPASKDGEGIIDPDTHLKGYQIKKFKGEPRHERQTNIKVVNQFGELFVDTIRPDRLLVPTAKDLDEMPPPPYPEAHNVDHYKCYNVKVTRGAPKFPKGIQVFIEDQFEQPKLYDVKKPTRLCIPVDKNGEGIKDRDAHLMCYKVKPAKGEPKYTPVIGIFTNNQFGSEQLDTKKEEELCVPSEKFLEPL
jgi:hypothetical protein